MKYLMILSAILLTSLLGSHPGYAQTGTQPDAGFFKAAQTGDVETFKKYLAAGVNVNALDPSTAYAPTALMYAAQYGKLEIAKLLIQNHAAVDQYSVMSGTALIQASSNNHVDLVEYLLENHATVDEALGNERYTPLMCAESRGYLDIVNVLLAHGADPRLTSNGGPMMVNDALSRGYDEVAKALLKGGAWYPLYRYGNAKAIAARLQIPFVDFVKQQIKNKLPLDVHYLVYFDFVIDIDERSPETAALIEAASSGDTEIVSLMIQAGADLSVKNADGNNAIMMAAAHGKTDAVKVLVQANAPLDVVNPMTESALTLAFDGNYTETENVLIQSGASPFFEKIGNLDFTPAQKQMILNFRNKDGADHLVAAAKKNVELKVIDQMLRFGFDVNSQDRKGLTSLAYAAQNKNWKTFSFLIGKKADLDHQDINKRTILMEIAARGDLDSVYELFHQDLHPNKALKDKDGKTASQIATDAGFSQVALAIDNDF